MKPNVGAGKCENYEQRRMPFGRRGACYQLQRDSDTERRADNQDTQANIHTHRKYGHTLIFSSLLVWLVTPLAKCEPCY